MHFGIEGVQQLGKHQLTSVVMHITESVLLKSQLECLTVKNSLSKEAWTHCHTNLSQAMDFRLNSIAHYNKCKTDHAIYAPVLQIGTYYRDVQNTYADEPS